MQHPKINYLKLFKEAFREFVRDRYQNIAGSLAYYQFLAIGPLVGFSIYFSNRLLGANYTESVTKPIFESSFTSQIVKVIVFFLKIKTNLEEDNFFSLSVISAVILGYSTKEYFGMIRDTIEQTWNEVRDEYGFMGFLKRLKEDLTITFGAVFIIFLFLILGSVLPFRYKLDAFGIHYILFHASLLVFEFFFFFTLLNFYFCLVTPIKLKWNEMFIPALIGAVLQLIGRGVMRSYMSNYPDADIAESLIIVLLWFYYSNIVFIYSAEFAKVYITQKKNIDLHHLKGKSTNYFLE